MNFFSENSKMMTTTLGPRRAASFVGARPPCAKLISVCARKVEGFAPWHAIALSIAMALNWTFGETEPVADFADGDRVRFKTGGALTVLRTTELENARAALPSRNTIDPVTLILGER